MGQSTRYSIRCAAQFACVLVTLGGLLFLPGCGEFDLSDLDLGDLLGSSDDAGTGDDGDAEPADGLSDLTGSWSVFELDFSNCSDDVESRAITWNIVHEGTHLTIFAVGGNLMLSGTLSGNVLELFGSFPDDGGTMTITGSNVTVNDAGNSISGTTSWNWSDGFELCAGTTTISGNRN